jgi:flagellar capping protein FliD
MDQDEAMFGAEPKVNKKRNFCINIKWISFGVVGSLFAVSHIGMIGHLATRKIEPTLPLINPPVGPYTSYKVSVSKEGYAISYKANDPKTAYITKDIKEKGGFLGLANENTQITEEYFMDGQTNQGGSVSNNRSWLDKKTKALEDDINSSTQKSEACIKAIGSAEGTGRLVGTSIGAAAAPTLSTIPFVGWVAAGWVAMFGGNQGAEMGGNMAEDLNKNC